MAPAPTVTAVTVDAWSRVAVSGVFTGTVTFGGSALASAGGSDAFVAHYQGASGAHLWSKRFGGSGEDYGNDLAVAPDGNVVVTGQFATTIDFGSRALTNVSAPDIFVAELSSAGAHIWSARFGKPSGFNQVATGVAVDAVGRVLLAANVTDAVDFGGGALPTSGGYDPVVVQSTVGAAIGGPSASRA